MAKYFVDKGGEAQEFDGGRRRVRFPVCLAIRLGADVKVECADFVLNVADREVLVKGADLPSGSRLTMHFYIPPESKLLGEFTGVVTAVSPAGARIRLIGPARGELLRLEAYLEEKRRLTDRSA
ncbi:MAG: hypothetical protein Kow0025_04040 [Thermodesulfovibrionales bacterium]